MQAYIAKESINVINKGNKLERNQLQRKVAKESINVINKGNKLGIKKIPPEDAFDKLDDV